MKKAIGGIYIYNLVIIFLLIAFAFICALLSYTKAFKVSKSMASIIEKSSGYNTVSQATMTQYLTSIGYQMIKQDCPVRGKLKGIAYKGICIYEIDNNLTDNYINYGIISYMTIDLPLINLIKIPVYIETEKIYIFK